MRARAPKSQKKTEYKSYPVKVEEFITAEDAFGKNQTGVKGINLATGKPITVFMTVPKNEEMAQKYKNRPSLEKWSKTFVEFGTKKTIEPGAVLFFNTCIPFNGKDDPLGKHYKATWVDRMGDNPESVQDRFVRGYMVVEGSYQLDDMIKDGAPVLKEDGSPVKTKTMLSGHALSFEYRPDKFITGKPGEEMLDQIKDALAAKNNPQLLVRFMDANNQVCAEAIGSRSWEDKETRRSPEDAAALWNDDLEALLKSIPDAESLNIIPVEKYALSKEGIEKGNIGPAFKKMDFACHHFEEGTKLCNMQHCFGLVGMDEHRHILNKLDSVEKENKDIVEKDPTLLGGLSYSPSFEANMEFLEAANSEDADQELTETDGQSPS